MKKISTNEFVGFDLGHGESALGRAFGATTREPEILELSLIHISEPTRPY